MLTCLLSSAGILHLSPTATFLLPLLSCLPAQLVPALSSHRPGTAASSSASRPEADTSFTEEGSLNCLYHKNGLKRTKPEKQKLLREEGLIRSSWLQLRSHTLIPFLNSASGSGATTWHSQDHMAQWQVNSAPQQDGNNKSSSTTRVSSQSLSSPIESLHQFAPESYCAEENTITSLLL